MSHQETCQACAARPGVCPMCLGTATVTVPSITDKIAFHLMHNPQSGLGLVPAELAELGEVLGLLPATPAVPDYPPADTCICEQGGGQPHVHIAPPDGDGQRPDPV